MTTFNRNMPGDMITLEMRIHEETRHVLKSMFISSDERIKMLENALESAISKGNLLGMVEKYANQAIIDAIEEYFSHGEGSKIINKAISDVLTEVIPTLFKKET